MNKTPTSVIKNIGNKTAKANLGGNTNSMIGTEVVANAPPKPDLATDNINTDIAAIAQNRNGSFVNVSKPVMFYAFVPRPRRYS